MSYNDFGLGNLEMFNSGVTTAQGMNMDVAALQKALSAGDSANPAGMGTGGNTLQFESLETQLVDALTQRPEDFKLMKKQPKNGVGSTVHQYTQAQDSGSIEGVNTAELGAPLASISQYERKTRNIKYFQTQREASLQANLLNPIVGSLKAEAEEERMGTHVLLKATEYTCFHGDEDAISNQPNGYPKQIRDEYSANVFDMRGARILDTAGLAVFEKAIGAISALGGDISDAFFPYVLAQDWQKLLQDRQRFNENSSTAGMMLSTYQSMYGNSIKIAGEAGIDKMYFVKQVPTASSALLATRPDAPTIALTPGSKTGGTGFITATAGDYRYTVYAVSATGLVSVASTAVNATAAAGQEVSIAITEGTLAGSGYIVCRGKKDVTTGTDVREMYKVAWAAAVTTTLDQNDELPGTAEILLMTSNGVQSTYQWDSFCDLKRFPLGATRASIPFLLLWYGTPDMKIAKFNGLIKNVGHVDIDGWF